METIYPDWLKLKSLETTSTGYIRRIDDDWKTYYLNVPIIHKDICQFTKAHLLEWALRKIHEKSLTKKQYYNMALIILHSLEYAADYGFIPINPFIQFKVDGKLFQKAKKPEDCTQVLLMKERPFIEAE